MLEKRKKMKAKKRKTFSRKGIDGTALKERIRTKNAVITRVDAKTEEN